jgi:hypothetical protein
MGGVSIWRPLCMAQKTCSGRTWRQRHWPSGRAHRVAQDGLGRRAANAEDVLERELDPLVVRDLDVVDAQVLYPQRRPAGGGHLRRRGQRRRSRAADWRGRVASPIVAWAVAGGREAMAQANLVAARPSPGPPSPPAALRSARTHLHRLGRRRPHAREGTAAGHLHAGQPGTPGGSGSVRCRGRPRRAHG